MMASRVTSAPHSIYWIRVIARFLAVCWAGFWGLFLLFNLVKGLTAGANKPLRGEALVFIVLALVSVIVPTVLAWRAERTGGIGLVIVGLVIAVFGFVRPPGGLAGSGLVEALLMQALLPVVAGVLFLICGREAEVPGSRFLG
jgi:hypothetical protein